ncbi:hypothetical protein D046_9194, partial [Vibrio parahaemolyticus V-223/04]
MATQQSIVHFNAVSTITLSEIQYFIGSCHGL